MSEVRIRDEALVHELTLPVLGVPVRLRSDAPEIIEAFESAFGGWREIEGRADLLSSARLEGDSSFIRAMREGTPIRLCAIGW